MSCCAKCGCELAPGEGKVSNLSNWRHPGLLCDSCYKENQGAVGGFISLVVGTIVGAVCGCMTLSRLGPVLGENPTFDAARHLTVGVAVGGLVLWLVMYFLGRNVSGCLAKLFFKLLSFVFCWTGIALLAIAYFKGGSMMKSLVGIE